MAAIVIDHPVLAHRLGRLRSTSTDNDGFRLLVGQIASLLAYEALRDLATVPCSVDTPVAQGAPSIELADKVMLVPILRAGLGMIPAIEDLVPGAEVAHLGMRRDEETLLSSVYLNRLPADLEGRRVLVCDPMVATGGSLAVACDLVKERNASSLQALCLIASQPGLTAFARRHSDIDVYCAAIDPTLDSRGYIVPGLGDAGDRLFGPPD